MGCQMKLRRRRLAMGQQMHQCEKQRLLAYPERDALPARGQKKMQRLRRQRESHRSVNPCHLQNAQHRLRQAEQRTAETAVAVVQPSVVRLAAPLHSAVERESILRLHWKMRQTRL